MEQLWVYVTYMIPGVFGASMPLLVVWAMDPRRERGGSLRRRFARS